jgi:hypothetical protein
MVWSPCVVFFQAALLAGYLAAHLSTRPGLPRWVGVAVPALLAGAVVALPTIIPIFSRC